jgi:c-di-GMP-binding flagellar brake protein YcgR
MSNFQVELLWTTAIVVGILAAAVLLEIGRRRTERRRLLEAEWRSVRDIVEEKDLSQDLRKVLQDFIRRYGSATPLRMITVRQNFDEAVEKDIAALENSGRIPDMETRGIILRDIRTHIGLDYVPVGHRLDSSRELHSGQTLWLAPSSGVSEWTRMNVAGVDEAYFRCVPLENSPTPPMKAGDELRFRLWHEEDARYGFVARFVRLEDNPPTWVFRHAKQLDRMQARAHFRIRIDQSAEIGVLDAPVDGDMHDVDQRTVVTRLRGRVTSLSGGGFAVLVPQPVPRQVLLRFVLELGEQGQAEVTGRLVNTASMSGGRYLLRAAFAGVPEDTRERITHFIFQRQQPAKFVDAAAAAPVTE